MENLIKKHKPNSYCYSGSGMLTNTYDDNVATKMATDSANITKATSIGFVEWIDTYIDTDNEGIGWKEVLRRGKLSNSELFDIYEKTL